MPKYKPTIEMHYKRITAVFIYFKSSGTKKKIFFLNKYISLAKFPAYIFHKARAHVATAFARSKYLQIQSHFHRHYNFPNKKILTALIYMRYTSDVIYELNNQNINAYTLLPSGSKIFVCLYLDF